MSIKDKFSFSSDRQLDPLPKGLSRLYGIIAVLVVLIPEWFAGNTLMVFPDNWGGSQLPTPSSNWYNLPELRLSSMNLAELRLFAYEVGLRNYSKLNRERLLSRLIKYIHHNATALP